MFKSTGWVLYSLIVGTFGQVAYLADLLKPHVPGYLAVGFLIVPVWVVIFVHEGEWQQRTVARWHLLAALWFAAITILAEVLSFAGYAPSGTTLYRVCMHLGWIHCAAVLRFQFKSSRSFHDRSD